MCNESVVRAGRLGRVRGQKEREKAREREREMLVLARQAELELELELELDRRVGVGVAWRSFGVCEPQFGQQFASPALGIIDSHRGKLSLSFLWQNL